DALLRLHKTLLARRGALRKALAGELADLRNKADAGGSADVALDSGSEEISTQLAELGGPVMSQIERALAYKKRGSYGSCRNCQCKIPVARLNAIPYSTTCIECQREMENYPGWSGGKGGDWEKVYDAGGPSEEDREVNISQIEMDLSH